jgi:3-methyladenine DNA glycosylase AlkD
MTVRQLLTRIRSELKAQASPAVRESMQRFSREPLNTYGVPTAVVRKIEQAAWREVRPWPAEQLNQLCEALWRSGKLEEAAVALGLYRRLKKRCGEAEFALFERWLDRYVDNWGSCDGLATWLLAASIENRPELISRLEAWTRSANRWKRRAAITALLQEAKQGRRTAAIFDIAGRLLEDSDDLVRKGVGWVLKETYPKRPREVLAFLGPRKARAPRLVLRLAAEKMTARDRAQVLAR